MQTAPDAGVQQTQGNKVWDNIKMLFTTSYYKEQFSGWQIQNYLLLAFGLGVLVMNYVASNDFGWVNTLSTVGGIIGFSCVNSIAQNKPINGILGLVSAIMIIIVAFHATAYNDILMQLSYVLVLDLPIILYGRAWQSKRIHASSLKEFGLIVAFFLVVFGALYYSDTHFFISKSPLYDALGAAFGLTGALSMMLKTKIQTLWWIGQGIVSIALWADLAMKGATTPTLLVVYILYFSNNLLMLTISPWGMNIFKKNKN